MFGWLVRFSLLIVAVISFSSEAAICPTPLAAKGAVSETNLRAGPSRIGGGSCTVTKAPTTPSSISYPSTSTTGAYSISWGASTGFSGNLAKYYLHESTNGGSYVYLAALSSTTTSYTRSGKSDGIY